MERRITDNIYELRRVLPPHLNTALDHIGNTDDLLEIVLDLGRVPTARYLEGEMVLLEEEVTRDDIDAIVNNIGTFDADNRAGLERTLHRISGIRNRRGDVVVVGSDQARRLNHQVLSGKYLRNVRQGASRAARRRHRVLPA